MQIQLLPPLEGRELVRELSALSQGRTVAAPAELARRYGFLAYVAGLQTPVLAEPAQ